MTDEQILQRFQATGDEKLFQRIYERYQLPVRSFVRRRTQASHVEDIVQETFFKVFRSISTYDTERRFQPWLWAVVKSVLIDHHRKSSTRREVTTEFEHGETASCNVDLEDLISTLTEHEKMAVNSFLAGENVREFADASGWQYERAAKCRKLTFVHLRAKLDPNA